MILTLVAAAQFAFRPPPELGTNWLLGKAREHFANVVMRGSGGAVGGTDFSDDAGCIVYYPLEGTDGAGDGQYRDDACTAGTEQDLTASGTANPGITTTGCNGDSDGIQCWEDNGGAATDGFTSADHADFEPNPITFGCMIKAPLAQPNNGYALNHWGSNVGIAMELPSGASWFNGYIGLGVEPTDVARADTWVSWIVRWGSGSNSGEIQTYLDGAQECTGACATNTTATDVQSAATLTIGHLGSNAIDGFLDDCFIYNAYLTPEQICSICKFGFDGQGTERTCNSCTP